IKYSIVDNGGDSYYHFNMAFLPKKVCIVYTENPDILRTARSLKNILNRWGCTITMKPAGETKIPDLTPADLILLGAEESLSLPNSSYKELYRSFQGVNFAGRKGSLFSTSLVGIEALRGMVQDSELELVHPFLVVREDTNDKNVETWLRPMLE
ncbi:MAG: hypothetical protein N2442_02375, partial [Spirochaetes bacterium]|nr:hypothetical protein [Spirochaetota bacterium]